MKWKSNTPNYRCWKSYLWLCTIQILMLFWLFGLWFLKRFWIYNYSFWKYSFMWVVASLMLDERLLLFWPLLHLLSLVTVHSWICMFLLIKSPYFPKYHCIHGIHDCFDHVLFITYICLTVALRFDEKPVPLPEIYPLKVWANYGSHTIS